MQTLEPLRAIFRVFRELREARPEIVVADGAAAAATAVPAALAAGVRVAVCDVDSRLAARFYGHLLAAADAVLEVRGTEDAASAADGVAADLAAAAGRPGAGLADGPPLSVITTVLNEEEAVEQLLSAVVPQLRVEDELLVVDGGSTDGTAARVAAWSAKDQRVRPLHAPGSNISAGRNVGIGAARYGVVACTDAGCLPDPGWLEALRLPFGEERRAPALVTGVYRVRARNVLEEAQAVACHADPHDARRPSLLARVYGRVVGRVSNPTMPIGRSMAVSKEAWEAVGGFAEDLYAAEDVTFGRAIAKSGRSCVLAAHAQVAWLARPSLRATARMYYIYGFWGGRSGDPLLVGRDLVRAAAYLLGPAALWRGGIATRVVVGAAATAYGSLPLARALRRSRPLPVVLGIPLALAVMDLGKATGCLRGLWDAKKRTSKTAAAPPHA